MTGDFRRHLIAGLAVALVVLGTAGPISGFLWFERRAGKDNLAWEEGFGFIVMVACLVAVALCQVAALVLARQSWGLFPAKAAGFAAIGLLALAVIFHLWAFWGCFRGCWAFIWTFISGWWR